MTSRPQWQHSAAEMMHHLWHSSYLSRVFIGCVNNMKVASRSSCEEQFFCVKDYLESDVCNVLLPDRAPGAESLVMMFIVCFNEEYVTQSLKRYLKVIVPRFIKQV